MANAMDFKVVGDQDLIRLLGLIPDKAIRVLAAGLRKGARPMAKAAKAKAPKDSGLLIEEIGTKAKTRKSVKTYVVLGAKREKKEVTRHDKRPGRTAYTMDANAGYYAHLVEFGTWKDPAQPFMRPAWDENVAGALAIVEKHVADAVEREFPKA